MKMEPIIVYEDKDMIVCHKMAGIATQTAKLGQKDMVSEIKNYLRKQSKDKSGEPYVGVIHRLDQPVEGLLVFAKTKAAAKELSAQVEKHVVKKYYFATVCGKLEQTEGVLVDYLVKDGKTNTSRIGRKEDKEAKRASLSYCVKSENKLLASAPVVSALQANELTDVKDENITVTKVEILLETGRHHQIRVQFSKLGHPLLGDMKYGNEESLRVSREKQIKTVALCAYKLQLNHPRSREKMLFEITPQNEGFFI